MAKILFSSTNGSDNPTKAAVPFLGAKGTIEGPRSCAAARGVIDADLQGKNAKFITPKDYVELIVAADRVVSS